MYNKQMDGICSFSKFKLAEFVSNCIPGICILQNVYGNHFNKVFMNSMFSSRYKFILCSRETTSYSIYLVFNQLTFQT